MSNAVHLETYQLRLLVAALHRSAAEFSDTAAQCNEVSAKLRRFVEGRPFVEEVIFQLSDDEREVCMSAVGQQAREWHGMQKGREYEEIAHALRR